MNVYFDTNVLIAALKTDHVHHLNCYAAVDRVFRGEIRGHIAAHGLVELYSVMTRTPFTTPIHPSEVLILVNKSILPIFQIIEVSTQSHLDAIALCAEAGWKGGRVHDAVHIQAAKQAGCDLIYTHDLADFHRLAPEMASRIQVPPSS